MSKHLIEITYEYAKEKFGNTPFTFKELFNALLKKDKSIKDYASDLYIELLQDIRFISLGKQRWSLREYFTLSEINKITSSMFGLDEYYENDIDGYIPPVTKVEEETEIEEYIDEDSGKNLDSAIIVSEDDDITVEEEIKSSTNIEKDGDEETDDSDDEDDEDFEIEVDEEESEELENEPDDE